jgi:hypothetical protein
MRTNEPGAVGRYSCDRCQKPSPRGVMTGCTPFEHVCLWCYGVWRKLPKHSALVKHTPLLGVADPWLTVPTAEIEERESAGGWADKAFEREAR